jgi:hypothetical protein
MQADPSQKWKEGWSVLQLRGPLVLWSALWLKAMLER